MEYDDKYKKYTNRTIKKRCERNTDVSVLIRSGGASVRSREESVLVLVGLSEVSVLVRSQKVSVRSRGVSVRSRGVAWR